MRLFESCYHLILRLFSGRRGQITYGQTLSLQLKSVTKVYGQGGNAVRAVDSVSLDIRSSELVLLMGPSGGGKTTLLTIAGGLLRPTSGQVFLGGVDLFSLSDREISKVRRATVGFIFQSFNLLSALNASENVEVVMRLAGVGKAKAQSRAEELLLMLGLKHRLRHKPADLSGGERQRVSIARALANDAHLILADEPTANLDSQRGHDVMQMLKEIGKKEDRSILIASHDQRIRDFADRVVWMEDGKTRDIRSVKDPVCGMVLDEASALVRLSCKGSVYFFCGQTCRDTFVKSQGA